MKWIGRKMLLGVVLLVAGAVVWAAQGQSTTRPATKPAEEAIPAERLAKAKVFLSDLAMKARAARAEAKMGLVGEDGWLFFVPELRAMSVGPFWGEAAKEASKANREDWRDPLPVIVDFNKQLEKAGIELLIVPVPGKAAVYPEKISDTVAPDEQGNVPRLDVHHQEFYALLREQGVTVLDPYAVLAKHRLDEAGASYCQTDTHWSGRGCMLTATMIHEHVKDRDWLKKQERKQYARESREVSIRGDIAGMIEDKQIGEEKLPLTFVGEKTDAGIQPLDDWRESPVLLMGDSHTLVFHIPDLHARGAGLADHLAYHFGFPVDLVGVRGSGASTTRIELYRRKDQLAGKKLVIWCMSMREFTESITGWRPVPIIK